MSSQVHSYYYSRECIFVKEREVSGTIVVVDASGLG